MANARIQQFEMTARVRTDTPSIAVGDGGAWDALRVLGAGLAGRLGQMADEAKQRERDREGQLYGGGEADRFVAQRTAENAARARAANIPGELDVHILAAADRYSVSADALRMIAALESSGNINAQNPNSSAGGPFQFIDSTARAYGLSNRFDPAEASDAAARLLRDNAAILQRALGREPTAAELYLAHQQGGQGAVNLLTNPSARAADIVGERAITLNGGRADMSAAEFANMWLTKAGGGGAAGNSQQQPVQVAGPSTVPLQLRRDGTLGGEAFDAAAIQAYGWRIMAQLSAELGQAAIENQDNPSGYAQAVQSIRQQYLQNEAFGDPAIRETFERAFTEKTTADQLLIASRHEARLRQEQVSAATGALDASGLELERHAYNLGAYGEADEILQVELNRALNQVNGMVAAGVLTPAEGETRRSALAETVFRAQVQGTFDQLGSPTEKQEFARQILVDYAEGKGPFGILSLAEAQSLSGELFRRATADANALTIQEMEERARVLALLQDDVISLRSTGQPLDFGASGIRAGDLPGIIGVEGFAKWQEERRAATEAWESTSQMLAMSEDDIRAYLAGIAPTAGQPGFAGQQQTHAEAVRVAETILAEREADPAGYAFANFPQVQSAWQTAVESQTPDAYRQAIAQTVNVQRQLGIASPQPLPKSQAQFVANIFGNPQLEEGERINAITHLVFASDDPEQQRMIFEQLVSSGVDGMASGALGAWARGDMEAARRLFQAVLVDPEKRPGKVPETATAINEVIQNRIMAPGAIGDVYYGISNGTAEGFLTAERDNNLLQRAVKERLLQGESLAAAVDGAAADLFGDLVPVRGGWQVNAEILLPKDADPHPYLTGLSSLVPQVRHALEGQLALPSPVSPDSSSVVEPGTIDLSARPIVENADGTISTLRSISFEEDGVEILVPTVSSDGLLLSDEQAIELYRQTGEHLGKFADADAATAYAQALHAQQEEMHNRTSGVLAILGGATSNYVEQVLREGYFRNVRDGFVYIDPFTASAVAGPDGRALIFTEAEVLSTGRAAMAAEAERLDSEWAREEAWRQLQYDTFGMFGGAPVRQ